jgi:hypothetical protein
MKVKSLARRATAIEGAISSRLTVPPACEAGPGVQQLVEGHVDPPPREEAAGHREDSPEPLLEAAVEATEEVSSGKEKPAREPRGICHRRESIPSRSLRRGKLIHFLWRFEDNALF